MNKYIKLLIESFFDDIEDNILDTTETLSDINMATAFNTMLSNIIKNSPYEMLVDKDVQLTDETIRLYEKYSKLAIFLINFELEHFHLRNNIEKLSNIPAKYHILIMNDNRVLITISTNEVDSFYGGKSVIVVDNNTGKYEYMPANRHATLYVANSRLYFTHLDMLASVYKEFGYVCETYRLGYMSNSISDKIILDITILSVSNVLDYLYNCQLPEITNYKLSPLTISSIYINDYESGLTDDMLTELCNKCKSEYKCKNIAYSIPNPPHGRISHNVKTFITWSIDNNNVFLPLNRNKISKDTVNQYIILYILDKIGNVYNYMYNIEKLDSATCKTFSKYNVYKVEFDYNDPSTSKHVYLDLELKVYASGKIEQISGNL